MKKYEIYAKAIYELLSQKFKPTEKISIILIGPGRGPIMREIIKSLLNLNFENFLLKAIEKNSNSCITLNNYLQENEGILKGRVQLICGDIREYVCDDKADVLISELIGSFGDNELSPELICSAERWKIK